MHRLNNLRIKKDALFLIDGSSLLYRSYYGIRPLQTATGIPTQATYGFCRSIKKLIDDFDPQYLIIVWDSKGKTFRSELFPAYKATRQAPPSDLFVQKDQIIEFADLAQIKQISKTGYEADDLLYSIVEENKKKDVVLISPDKDLHQLISKNLFILDPLKKEIIDEKVFFDKHEFKPEKLSFFHALVGDASDNIPGVKGIGKKGGQELVKQFKSLDDLYNNLDKVKKERTRSLLEQDKENAYLSLKLFTLKHIKVSLTPSKMAFDKTKWKNANPLFRELEFKRLITEPDAGEPGTDLPGEQTSFLETSFLEKTSTAGTSTVSKTKKASWRCVIVRDKDRLQKLVHELKEKKLFALDTETTGLKPLQERLVGLSIAYDSKKSYYIPLAHTDDQQLETNYVLETLKPIFLSKSIKKVLQHAKFDQLVLWAQESTLNGIVFDTLLAANLLRKEGIKINLKALSLSYLGEKMDSFKEVIGKAYKTFASVPIPEAASYAAHDALQTFKLFKILRKDLNKEKKLKHIFEKIEMPLSQILFEMERKGMPLDPEILKKLETSISKKLTTIENKITDSVGETLLNKIGGLNLNSPKQIEVLLFDELKLPVVKKNIKGTRSTDHEVLSELSKTNLIPDLILQYRELFKLKSTYILALPKTVNPKTNRIHTSFSQTIVATGRLSSSEPNLQNIPASSDWGLKIREAFIAPRGSRFLSADYSQIELRVLAQLTSDKNLIQAFLNEEDIHAKTAGEIFGVAADKVTHEQRQVGKRINFSIMYGLTPFGLSKDLDIKQSEAKIYIEKYFEQYPGVAKWMEETVEQAKKDGFTQTWLGRRRYVPGLNEKNKSLFMAARRIAVNSPVQGTSAEIMKLSMLKVRDALQKASLKSEIVLQIHDELIFECPTAELEKVARIAKKEMESIVKWKIPLLVSMRNGKNWAEITK